MGHTRLCNFHGELRTGTKGYTVGIESIKQARAWCKSDNAVNGDIGKIESVYLMPQTARAKKQTKGFYCLKVTADKTEYLNIEQLN